MSLHAKPATSVDEAILAACWRSVRVFCRTSYRRPCSERCSNSRNGRRRTATCNPGRRMSSQEQPFSGCATPWLMRG